MPPIDDYYKILDLPPSASLSDIKRAYRDMAQVWHPDRFQNNPRLSKKAEAKFKEISHAYQALLRGFEVSSSPLPPPPPPPPPPRRQPTPKTTHSTPHRDGRRGQWFLAAGVIFLFFILIQNLPKDTRTLPKDTRTHSPSTSDHFTRQKQRDIERAKYWESRGYDFDPNVMIASSMDLKVDDYERAKYWRSRGLNFDPEKMTGHYMDQEAKKHLQPK